MTDGSYSRESRSSLPSSSQRDILLVGSWQSGTPRAQKHRALTAQTTTRRIERIESTESMESDKNGERIRRIGWRLGGRIFFASSLYMCKEGYDIAYKENHTSFWLK
jgi:hypothetical protein